MKKILLLLTMSAAIFTGCKKGNDDFTSLASLVGTEWSAVNTYTDGDTPYKVIIELAFVTSNTYETNSILYRVAGTGEDVWLDNYSGQGAYSYDAGTGQLIIYSGDTGIVTVSIKNDRFTLDGVVFTRVEKSEVGGGGGSESEDVQLKSLAGTEWQATETYTEDYGDGRGPVPCKDVYTLKFLTSNTFVMASVYYEYDAEWGSDAEYGTYSYNSETGKVILSFTGYDLILPGTVAGNTMTIASSDDDESTDTIVFTKIK